MSSGQRGKSDDAVAHYHRGRGCGGNWCTTWRAGRCRFRAMVQTARNGSHRRNFPRSCPRSHGRSHLALRHVAVLLILDPSSDGRWVAGRVPCFRGPPMLESFSADAIKPRKHGGTHGIQRSSMTPRAKHAFAASGCRRRHAESGRGHANIAPGVAR